MNAALAVLPPPRGGDTVQTDAVLARCASIVSKARYVLPPIGLMYIASVLRERAAGGVGLADCAVAGRGEEPLCRLLRETGAGVLIVATGASTLAHDAATMGRLKRALPRLRIAAVGAHATACAEGVLRESCVDFVIRGEPELSAAELAERLADGSGLSEVRGIAYREGGGIVVNPPRPLLDPLDSLPFPARDLVARYRYDVPFARTDNFAIVLTSRGCPYPCTFCATRVYNGGRCRMRSAANVVAEIEEIAVRHGLRDIGFWDDAFTLSRPRVVEICERMIEGRLTVGWICLSRVDNVDRELLLLMRRAGCYQIQYGVESGDQGILDALKKGITLDQVRTAFDETRRCGIETAAFFMLGCPGETVGTMEKTLALARELRPDYASFNIATPYPGTALCGTDKPDAGVDWRRFDALHVAGPGVLAPELIQGYLRRAYLRFYFSPRYLWRRLRAAGSLRTLLRQARTGWGVLARFGPRGGGASP